MCFEKRKFIKWRIQTGELFEGPFNFTSATNFSIAKGNSTRTLKNAAGQCASQSSIYMNVFNACYVGVFRALGAFKAYGRVRKAGESIRAFSQSSSTAYISLAAVKTPCTSSVTNVSVANTSRCVKCAQHPDNADVVSVQNVHIWTKGLLSGR